MSRDKQIEEMVRAVCIQMRDYPKLTCKTCKADNNSTNAYCRIQFEMEQLYNAGYRKASKVAREIIDHIEAVLNKMFDEYAVLGQTDCCVITEIIRRKRSAEFKKKYTEGKDDTD